MHRLYTGWSRNSRIAAAAAGALMCMLIGALVGVTAAGGHPRAVLNVFTAPAADAKTHKVHNHTVTVTEPAQSPTGSAGDVSQSSVTLTVTQPASTVTQTETVTETVTETETTPATSSGVSSP